MGHIHYEWLVFLFDQRINVFRGLAAKSKYPDVFISPAPEQLEVESKSKRVVM